MHLNKYIHYIYYTHTTVFFITIYIYWYIISIINDQFFLIESTSSWQQNLSMYLSSIYDINSLIYCDLYYIYYCNSDAAIETYFPWSIDEKTSIALIWVLSMTATYLEGVGQLNMSIFILISSLMQFNSKLTWNLNINNNNVPHS